MPNNQKHQIYFIDCREGLEKLPDQSIDLVVSGPPYFDHIVYSKDEKNLSTKNYQDFLRDISEVWEKLERKLKDGGIVAIWLHDIYVKKEDHFELISFHSDIIKTFPEDLALRQIVIWDRYLKKIYTDLPKEEQFGARFQYILVFSKGKTAYEKKLKDFYWKPVWYFKTMPRFLGLKMLYHIVFFFGKIFYLQKILNPIFSQVKKVLLQDKYKFRGYQTTCPPELAQMLIKIFSKKEDTVCDPFLGSGTTLKVTNKLKRRCVGFEINKDARKMILEKISSKNVEVFE